MNPYKKFLNGKEVLFFDPVYNGRQGDLLMIMINQKIEKLHYILESGNHTQKDYTDFQLLQKLVKESIFA